MRGHLLICSPLTKRLSIVITNELNPVLVLWRKKMDHSQLVMHRQHAEMLITNILNPLLLVKIFPVCLMFHSEMMTAPAKLTSGNRLYHMNYLHLMPTRLQVQMGFVLTFSNSVLTHCVCVLLYACSINSLYPQVIYSKSGGTLK